MKKKKKKKSYLLWSIKKEATDVNTAASPTKLWNRATSCGKSVTAIRFATRAPMVPPTAMVAPICVRTSVEGAMTPTVAATPLLIPMMPKKTILILKILMLILILRKLFLDRFYLSGIMAL